MPTMKIHVTGQVCRTGYRYFIKEQASKFHIRGSVAYGHDHNVEIVAAGTQEDMTEFLKLVRTGNRDSKVEEVIHWEAPPGDFDSFEVDDPANDAFPDRYADRSDHEVAGMATGQ